MSDYQALNPSDTFIHRHIGPSDADVAEMLGVIGCKSLDDLIGQTVPAAIRMKQPLRLGPPRGEHELIEELRGIASQNKVMRSMIGMGYHDCITPPVILRNILENPGWYTQYTPYQAEISQGRLEALLNFQTMVSDLVALPLANASLLDEATAAAEAMHMCRTINPPEAPPSQGGEMSAAPPSQGGDANISPPYEGGAGGGERSVFFVADDCHPQTINVVKTRARPLGIEVVVGSPSSAFGEQRPSAVRSAEGGRDSEDGGRTESTDSRGRLCSIFGLLLQYPTTDGRIVDYSGLIEQAHAAGVRVVVATDLLACTLIRPPGEFGADIAIGSAQRFGVPMGFGGPHAAFLATREEFARQMPGRIIGVSKDAHGRPAYRLAIQTREQHIRREKATSNICTAQALLANMASMYAVYHGPDGLRRIAQRVHGMACLLREELANRGIQTGDDPAFDTLRVRPVRQAAGEILRTLRDTGFNLRDFGDGTLGIACDETTTPDEIARIVAAFGPTSGNAPAPRRPGSLGPFTRQTEFLTHPAFNSYHSETELLRYMKRLENRDLSLAQSMIPLGSCTMKLNGTSEMLPVTWPEFGRMHPFAPPEQTKGYAKLFKDLEEWLAEITGLPAVSLQPNAGSQGEYAGLLAIRAYHESNGPQPPPAASDKREATNLLGTTQPGAAAVHETAGSGRSTRDVCLIPTSAHGTNPASAVTAGFRVVAVACDAKGNIDLADLRAKAEQHAANLGALMVTYPSTHGVFEEGIRDICDIIHRFGGQVYLDGANMNAQVGLCRPGDFGADVCHLNLHKTFCIPHGGGGPGMGPIAAAAHLAPYLPGNPLSEGTKGQRDEGTKGGTVGPVSAAPYGSASILPISWVYIALMGGEGLKRATEVAILNANYMAKRLEQHYPIIYAGRNGRVAHEFIADCRHFEKSSGIKVEDIAKRLMDFGFHAPTMSFPVPGTLMIEPTESESKAELDRLCDALIIIREEIRAIEEGRADRTDNALKHAPHTAEAVSADVWPHKYSRQQAAFPAPWVRERKFWPAVGRIDNVYGDRNLMCTCPPMESYSP